MPQFHAGVDAAYGRTRAHAACVLFRDWPDATATRIPTATVENSAEYEPGAFYKRELPVLMAVLGKLAQPPRTVIVDGYVWLDGNGRPGLGAFLYEALERKTPVIGVAKTRFRGDCCSIAVTRGLSQKPLYVTAAGMCPEDAARAICSMHGRYRIPALLRLADQEARRGLLA